MHEKIVKFDLKIEIWICDSNIYLKIGKLFV